ncbi:BZ3500_MvSof-1268-A1-R1_Chr1-3g02040 [Microbotryum saponariae]|uniref:N-alpha-acetyltransferase 40 n=1 Tax=Microbotryum saponariae TaxID=289078 RepID=A0A2X0MRY6_9BASI|nr:BZ3500_MvSof-1268-A1-R1_Chr1-3g02040 [Microbotryum saponariae]SCZ95234.1 BZ3501_MvSof-1269-A2-R1_Chr1-3g01642 [Microbotryum saponariae]
MQGAKLVPHLPNGKLEASLRDGTRVAIDLYTAATLPKRIKTWVWDLYEKNMKQLFTFSSEGFDPTEKRKELFHSDSRILVLRSLGQEPSLPSSSEDLVGFSIFRFDTEETAHETRLADVVYCYELQVDPSRRRTRAAKLLMDCLEWIAKGWKMDKVMLTCLRCTFQFLETAIHLSPCADWRDFVRTANAAALAFYESQGYAFPDLSVFLTDESFTIRYTTDEIDPSFFSQPEVDYRILSRVV